MGSEIPGLGEYISRIVHAISGHSQRGQNPGILRSVITCPFMEGYKLHLTQTQ